MEFEQHQKPNKKNRSKSYQRHQRDRVIAKKVYIYTIVMGNELIEYRNGHDFPHFRGRFAKGKVHCSCWMCSPKTRHGERKINEQKKLESMKHQLKNYWKEL